MAAEITEDGMLESDRHQRLRPYEVQLKKFDYHQVRAYTSYCKTSVKIILKQYDTRECSRVQCSTKLYCTVHEIYVMFH